MTNQRTTAVLVAALVAVIVAANVTAALFGQVHLLGTNLVAPWGTVFAAAPFVLRDQIQRAGGWRWVAVAIVAGTVVSVGMGLLIGSPIPGISAVRIALASGLAFALSELLDATVYTSLRERSVVAAMLVSNTVGAALDSAVFLTASGFGLTAAAFWGQVVVKALLVSPPAVAFLVWRDRRQAALS